MGAYSRATSSRTRGFVPYLHFNIHSLKRSVVALCLALVARGAAAQTPVADTLLIDLPAVRRLALIQSPELLAARQETAIAQGERRQARTYPFNPELGALFPGVPGGTGGLYELSVTQEIEWAGQRGLRAGAADFGVTRATAVVRDATRRTVGDASIAFYRAVAAQSRLRLAEQSLALSDRLITAIRTQIREGEISTLEANLAEIETGRARGRVLASRREANAAELELKRSIGLAPEIPVRVLADSVTRPAALALQPDSLVQAALSRRPDIAAAAAASRQAVVLTALARREALPNMRVGAVAERDAPGEDQRIGIAVGVGLPLLNRNRGLIERRRAEATQLHLQARATELAVRTDVLTAVRAYETAAAEVTVYESSVLQPARQNAALLEAAYRAGKFSLPTLLLLRNQLLDAELNYWDAWFAFREASVRLEVATASVPLDLPAPEQTPLRNRP